MGAGATKIGNLKNLVNNPQEIFDDYTIEQICCITIPIRSSNKIKVWLQMLQQYQLQHYEYLDEELEFLNQYSDFQRQLLIQNIRSKPQEFKLNPIDAELNTGELVNFIRLLQLSHKEIQICSQNENQSYFNQVSNLIVAMRFYCTHTNLFLKQIKDPALKWKFYASMWEHFSKRLTQIKQTITFSLINDLFNQKNKINLKPILTTEAVGAKLWSEIEIEEEYIIQQIKLARVQRNSNLPIEKILNVLLDMKINYYNLQFAGTYEFHVPSFIKELQKQSFALYNENFKGDYESLYKFWKEDQQYLLKILPQWIVDNYIDTTLFDFIEGQLRLQIQKLSDKERDQLKSECEKDDKIIQMQNLIDSVNNYQDISENQQLLLDLRIPTFNEYVVNNSESSLYKISKSLFQSQTTMNYHSSLINYQQFSSYSNQQYSSNISIPQQNQLQDEEVQLKEISLEELKFIINKYDAYKLPIQNRINMRENQIQRQNSNIKRINQKYQKFFDFSPQKLPYELMKEFIQSLQNDDSIQQVNSCVISTQDRSVAEELFRLLEQ